MFLPENFPRFFFWPIQPGWLRCLQHPLLQPRQLTHQLWQPERLRFCSWLPTTWLAVKAQALVSAAGMALAPALVAAMAPVPPTAVDVKVAAMSSLILPSKCESLLLLAKFPFPQDWAASFKLCLPEVESPELLFAPKFLPI